MSHNSAYRAGTPAPPVREKGLWRTHFWEKWPLLLGAPESILSRMGGRRGVTEGDCTPRSSRARREERRGARPRDWRPELVKAAAAGTPQASPHERPHLSNPAASPAGKGIRCHRLTGPAGGGDLWLARDAMQTPASSSARPAPRWAPLRSGGGRGSRRPGSGAQAATAASSSPRRPPS